MNKNIITITIIIIAIITALVLIINKSDKSNTPNTSNVLNAMNNENRLVNSQEFISKYKSISGSILVDVRTPAEFNSSHISSAINIDYENLSFIDEVNKLDKTKTYFIYCRSGNRSARAHKIMKDAGIDNIYELKGGIVAGSELLK